jgi:hypothetical protein
VRAARTADSANYGWVIDTALSDLMKLCSAIGIGASRSAIGIGASRSAIGIGASRSAIGIGALRSAITHPTNIQRERQAQLNDRVELRSTTLIPANYLDRQQAALTQN